VQKPHKARLAVVLVNGFSDHSGLIVYKNSRSYDANPPIGEVSTVTREDPQFNLRLPKELKEKVKQRAVLNGRSLNAELVQIVRDALAQPSHVIGYRSDTEKLADAQAETVKKMVFETLVQMYADKK
jgi:plasmid stability protein